jgi:hypothetical protein
MHLSGNTELCIREFVVSICQSLKTAPLSMPGPFTNIDLRVAHELYEKRTFDGLFSKSLWRVSSIWFYVVNFCM